MTFYETQVNNSNSTFYCFTCICVIHVCGFAHVCTYTGRPVLAVRCFPWSLSTLHINAVSHLTLDPRVLRFDQSSWPAWRILSPTTECRTMGRYGGIYGGVGLGILVLMLAQQPHPRPLRQQSFTGLFYCSCCECVWMCGHTLLCVCHMCRCPQRAEDSVSS